MKRLYVSAILALVSLGNLAPQCLAGDVQGFPNHAFEVPVMPSTTTSPEESLMRSINQNNLSDDAQKISVKQVNGATILDGYVKDDKERQRISTLARQANCPGIVNRLKIKPIGGEDAKQPNKSKTIFIKKGKQIVVQ